MSGRRARALLVVGALAIGACDGSFHFDEQDGGVASILDAGPGACATNADCPTSMPLCDPTAGQCVACFHPSDCPANEPRCTRDHRCVQCFDSNDCPGELLCEMTSGQCNPHCQEEPDCPAAAPTCDEVHGVCAFCTSDVICSDDEPVCDTTSGLCVKCSANEQCPSGKPRCDTSGACVHCLTSSDCAQGQRCDPLLHDCV